MDLNKLRIFQMIQSALAVKGIDSTVLFITSPNSFCSLVVNKGLTIVQDFEATESELLEWHAEIERV
ncbi:hypothetical protein [Shewanella chilikensis]|uniref:hypothetical protein n=1 Tax=Shewanella chilikensis TaxID=558541 RepID=UPI003A9870F3